jgi:polysaccharide biosynthesis protein PslF
MPSGSDRHATVAPRGRSIGIVSTYPPELCGLATFAAALENELVLAGDRVQVVRIDGGEATARARPTAAVLVNDDPSSVRNAAHVLSQCDVVIIQHEYGIYGGVDGDEVLELMAEIEVPLIAVLHTVPQTPTPNQKLVLESVCRAADRVVVMTDSARTRLLAGYDVDALAVVTIPHGATSPTGTNRWGSGRRRDGLRLLTWGLLGPGKGIEHMITAMGSLRSARPRLRYTVAGVTHPKVLARDGDAYRRSLIQRTWAGGVADVVTFDDSYRDVPTLTEFVAASSVVVLPYDSRDQVTSGVLVDAIAAGRPVIATEFPHAVELLAGGAGIVVPHEDPVALADAIRAVATTPSLLASMSAEALRLAPTLRWSSVARCYHDLCIELSRERQRVAT